MLKRSYALTHKVLVMTFDTHNELMNTTYRDI